MSKSLELVIREAREQIDALSESEAEKIAMERGMVVLADLLEGEL